MFSLSGGFTVCANLVLHPPLVSGGTSIFAGGLSSGLFPGGWPTVLVGGSISLNGDVGLVTALGTWTGAGLCAQELVVSGLRCDLVRRYTPSVVLFLPLYDWGSLASLRMVPGSQVLIWWSSIHTSWPGWSGLSVRPAFCFLVIKVTVVVLLPLQLLLNLPRICCKAFTVGHW